MAFSLILMQKIAAMLIWALVGFIMVRKGILTYNDSKIISKLLLTVFQPCLIARSFLVVLNSEKMTGFIGGIIFSLSVELIWIILTRLIRKPLKLTVVDSANLIYTNCGNLVLPLVAMSLGEEYRFYIAAFQLTFNVLIWTHGVILIKGKEEVSVKKIFGNTNVIGLIIGLVLLFTQFRLPSVIDTATEGLASMVGPTSMIIIGMTIATSDLLGVFRFKKAYLITFLRLIVYPLLILVILYFTGVTDAYPVLIPVFMTMMLSVAAPPATLVSQLAVLYDTEAWNSSAYNVMGTLCSIVTMPIMIYLYQYLFPV